jgi:hypothetical protein
VFNRTSPDKKVVGVFVRFSCAASNHAGNHGKPVDARCRKVIDIMNQLVAMGLALALNRFWHRIPTAYLKNSPSAH